MTRKRGRLEREEQVVRIHHGTVSTGAGVSNGPRAEGHVHPPPKGMEIAFHFSPVRPFRDGKASFSAPVDFSPLTESIRCGPKALT